jgi:diaminohydroxyphosphoribosylaminopyrimidine deaminase/5-amino-6-(5-phosphoribosylamino)uracil reductase
MQENVDIKFIQRCLELAVRAEGHTYPNPMVGSVIVHNGEIIGEGYHLKAGEPHAEVNAINSVTSRELLRDSTLYVNLEPCSHTGKTPPCADLIISHKIPRVVIGSIDTSDKVSGKGIRKLKDTGTEVITGIMEKECRYLNRRFFSFNERKRPYITLKWAQSSDGFIDIIRQEGQEIGPTWITGKPERILVHRWRASEQSILAGGETFRRDNPLLNVREWKGDDPVRLILTQSGKLGDLAVYFIDGRTIIFTSDRDTTYKHAEKVILNNQDPSADQILSYLHNAGIQSLMIEGGAMVFEHFISAGLWDEARIFIGKEKFISGIKAPVISGKTVSETVFSCSMLRMIQKGDF